ncbi:GNAT family N-acetyltransferase [Limobrevibacterium gyesilva]|uniref:GNAT family N-acetyltransferase n=1 Tax=Limobrevibacterium gyesilva TaxID=2991712 RepID=A0AA41YRL4_9PROT|nr:GNAT family N-acetyltransferase [Limobrevibacterium gyesilva]MCW3477277.1 GNAT family N-acetyltransferase [Limobrevibacterium gyesilva]
MTPVLAVAADAAELGRMHVQSWRETYPGLLPDSLLAGLDPVQRGARWAEIIATGCRLFVVRDAAGIVGFGSCGDQRAAELPYSGEITALYVLRRAQRQGVGRRLMDVLARDLAAAGHHSAALWVMHGNDPAIRFYTALGGRPVAEKDNSHDGVTTRSIGYAWDDVTQLFHQQTGQPCATPV